MDLVLKNISENTAVALLAKATQRFQEDVESLSKDLNKKNKENTDLQQEVERLTGANSTLRNENSDLEDHLQKEKTETDNLKQKIGDLQQEVEHLTGANSTLRNENSDLEDRLQKERTETDDLKQKIGDLQQKVERLTDANSTLQKEKEKCFITSTKSKLKKLEATLDKSLKTLGENNFADFIKQMKKGLHETIEESAIKDDIDYYLKLKNGWLTNLASLYWWGFEERLSSFLPESLRSSSNLIEAFKDFLNYLHDNGYKISLPSGSLSATIDNYDYDPDCRPDIFKRLFPEFKPDTAIFCQISKLSFNDEKGKCIKLNP